MPTTLSVWLPHTWAGPAYRGTTQFLRLFTQGCRWVEAHTCDQKPCPMASTDIGASAARAFRALMKSAASRGLQNASKVAFRLPTQLPTVRPSRRPPQQPRKAKADHQSPPEPGKRTAALPKHSICKRIFLQTSSFRGPHGVRLKC